MSLRAALGTVRRQALCSFHRRIVPLGNRGPVVSFAFDDFPRTAYTMGGPMLQDIGARGTYYASAGLMNTWNELGEQFSADDLSSLVADGHELASHTFSHTSSRSVSLSAFLQDVRKGLQSIHQITNVVPSANFAYPYGAVTFAAKSALGREMMSCRGICRGINGPYVDLNLLRAHSLYGGINQLPQVEESISENQKKKGWLIFYTHDVRDNPSRYGCTPALLKAVLTLVSRRGLRVSTVAEVVSEMRSQS